MQLQKSTKQLAGVACILNVRVLLGLYWVILGVILGVYWVILGLYY